MTLLRKGVFAASYASLSGGGGLSLPIFTEKRENLPSPSISTLTVPDLDLGPAQTRTVFAVWSNAISYGNSLTAITIAGHATTMAAEQGGAANIAYATLDSSITTGDVTLVTSSAYGGTGTLAIYYSVPVTKEASGTQYNTNPLTTTIATAAGGFALATVGTRNVPTHTWTGIIKDRDVAQGSIAMTETPESPITISDTLSGAYQYPGLATASFRPALTPVVDTFNRADSIIGLGTSDSGHTWVPITGVLGITSSEAYLVSGDALSIINFGSNTMQVSAKVSVFSDYWPAIYACKDVNGAGGFMLTIDRGGAKLSGYGGAYPIVNGDTISLRVASASETTVNVSLLINGISKITWSGQPKPSEANTYAGFDIKAGRTQTRVNKFLTEEVA